MLNMREFKIGSQSIGGDNPCFIVAEVSANHKQKSEEAEALVEAAARAGADAVKLQTYTPDSLTIDSDKPPFRVGGGDNPQAWEGKTFYQLYQEAYTPREWHQPLKVLAEKHRMTLFSSPFAPSDVDFLVKLGVPAIKVASYEATDIPLLKHIARTGLPVIISVGFATLEEVDYSVKVLRGNGCRDLAILHCTTSYQDHDSPEHTNLRTMHDIAERFDVVAGFSDNMGGVEIPSLAAAAGAAIIEKHIVLKHGGGALDDQFSLDEAEFKKMVDKIRWQERVMGKVNYGCQTSQEEHNRRYRRSLFAVADIAKGDEFTPENVRDIRPADGLETKYYDRVVGRRAALDIERGTPLSWDLVEGGKNG